MCAGVRVWLHNFLFFLSPPSIFFQDPSGYLKGLDRALKATQPCFDPSVGKVVPWVDRKVFATAALGQSNCTVS